MDTKRIRIDGGILPDTVTSVRESESHLDCDICGKVADLETNVEIMNYASVNDGAVELLKRPLYLCESCYVELTGGEK